MYEYQTNPFQNPRMQIGDALDVDVRQYSTAFDQFNAALLKGKLFRWKQKALHRKPFLYELHAVKSALALRGSWYAGVHVIPTGSIIGSEGKTADFDLGFHPMRKTTRDRWINVAVAYMGGFPLPPIQVIEIGEAYFIRDGHHRVSVSRAFGQVAMDAEIITWNAAPPFPWEALRSTYTSLSESFKSV